MVRGNERCDIIRRDGRPSSTTTKSERYSTFNDSKHLESDTSKFSTRKSGRHRRINIQKFIGILLPMVLVALCESTCAWTLAPPVGWGYQRDAKEMVSQQVK